MKSFTVLGIILSLALILFGICYQVPEKHLRTSEYDYNNDWTDRNGEEYVGGDAYNYQMEASLKAGYMSGVLAMKSITLVWGILLFFLTLYAQAKITLLAAQEMHLHRLVRNSAAISRKLNRLIGEEDESEQ